MNPGMVSFLYNLAAFSVTSLISLDMQK
jgi:hypothetical protein